MAGHSAIVPWLLAARCIGAYHLVDKAANRRQERIVSTPERPNDVRAQILEVSTRLFAADGFDGTPLQAIADEVGVAKPSLLYHFPSKDDLRQGVLEQLLSHWNDVLPRLLNVATSGAGRFDSLIGEVVGFFTADRDRARLLVREVLDRPQEMRALLRDHLSPWLSILADYIRRGQQEGSIHADVDPEAYLLQVIHLVVGGVAMSNVFEPLLREGADEVAVERQVAEITRVARASLFLAEGPEEAEAAEPQKSLDTNAEL